MDEKVKEAIDFIIEQIRIFGADKIATVNSFGKDSIVVQHLVNIVNPYLPVIWIKPPFLPASTIKFAEKVIEQWKLNVIIATSPFESNAKWMRNVVYKPQLWKTNPELCCQIFKVLPVMKAIRDLKLKAWFSGMRKTESEKRGMYTKVWNQGEFTKLHPILDFTEADIWRYIATRHLPIHHWYGLGYRSLGCELCSAPNVWYAERGGRWKDTLMEGGDCGIHCEILVGKGAPRFIGIEK